MLLLVLLEAGRDGRDCWITLRDLALDRMSSMVLVFNDYSPDL